MSTHNRACVEQMWVELEKTHDISVLDRYFDAGYVRRVGAGSQDLDGWKSTLGALYRAFPDLTTTVDVTVAEGDWVAYRWTSTGRHSDTYFGVPPTGKPVTAVGITINRFENGRIVEEYSSWNKVDVLHSLGILPIAAL
ncbi:ester cyclase [Nocardia sp. NPDC052112]|uniref:ester cyclase n=1 Tax=Nocardia sp. NPDC052112 TaxID=3155646 RepID=UPI00343DF215